MISEVGCARTELVSVCSTRATVTNDNPVTDSNSFRNISLLQLHVVYGGIIDLLWCLFNAIAFSLKKMYILAEDVYGR